MELDDKEFTLFFKRTRKSCPLTIIIDENNPITIDTHNPIEKNKEIIMTNFPMLTDRINAIQIIRGMVSSNTVEEIVLDYLHFEALTDIINNEFFLKCFSQVMVDNDTNTLNELGYANTSEYYRKFGLHLCSYTGNNSICRKDEKFKKIKENFFLCKEHYNYFVGIFDLLKDYICKDVIGSILIDYL